MPAQGLSQGAQWLTLGKFSASPTLVSLSAGLEPCSLTWGNLRSKKGGEGKDLLDSQVLISEEDYGILPLMNKKKKKQASEGMWAHQH